MHSINLETTMGLTNIDVPKGSVTLVVGPNGVGKSALLQDIYRKLPIESAVYYPGHRQITFSHGWDNLQIPLADLDNNLFAQFDGFNRYKSVWPEEQFKAILRKFQNSESAYNQKLVERLRTGESSQAVLSERGSPMQVLNNIFETARMSVRFTLTETGVTAVRSGDQYGVDRLSDGERAALFLAAAVANQQKPGVIIMDEPEKHLHPSISAPLVSSAVRARPDNAYIFATHDLNLIETLAVDKIIYIRNSQVISERPERRLYEVVNIDNLEHVAQDLKRDILGVRDKVLFVEGVATSLDMPLYAACFPEWKVAPRGGHEKVQEAVKTLNENDKLHWMQAIGIIDGDGRSGDEINELKLSKIIALPVPSIENLFFLREVVQEMCTLYQGIDGIEASIKMGEIDSKIGQFVTSNYDNIVARRTTWLLNRKISEQKVSVAQIIQGKESIDAIDILSIKKGVKEQLDEFLALPPQLDDVELLPIKATGIQAKIVELTGYKSVKEYKQSVLHQLDVNSKHGQTIKSAILGRLPVLP